MQDYLSLKLFNCLLVVSHFIILVGNAWSYNYRLYNWHNLGNFVTKCILYVLKHCVNPQMTPDTLHFVSRLCRAVDLCGGGSLTDCASNETRHLFDKVSERQYSPNNKKESKEQFIQRKSIEAFMVNMFRLGIRLIF